MRDALPTLLTKLREISTLGSIGSLLGWDEQVLLRPAGVEHRGDQAALVAKLTHQQFTSPEIGDLIAEVKSSDAAKDPESDAAAIARETNREYDRAVKLPTSLVEALSKITVLSQSAWAEARKKSSFVEFQPWLDKMLDLKRQEAECVGYASGNAYDALLDSYEPGETAAGIQKVFDSFRPELVELIAKIKASGKVVPDILSRSYDVKRQETFSTSVAAAIGFDFSAGRLDVSTHPFCSGMAPGDTRMTTRYNEHHFNDAFFGVLHETGHALYEQGLPKTTHFGSPLAEAISLGIHESQSRTWENLVGRSKPFWAHFMPGLRAAFPETLKDVSDADWLFAVNDVRPTLIRVEADEATYNLHVMLRFELEQALLSGDLETNDLPTIWNEKMQSYLGVTPPDDARGCLQDVHWSAGLLGYFPTYALGNLYAAQFFEKAKADLGDVHEQFARGEFAPLLGWLRENIHRHGKRYTGRQLVKRVTGSDLTPAPAMNYLRAKAAEYYGV